MSDIVKLSGGGYVTLVDHMGSDEGIERTARTSYLESGKRPLTKTRGLIRYLVEHGHTGPLEFAQVVFECRLPLFILRQLRTHRTCSFNEESARYCVFGGDFWNPSSLRMARDGKSQSSGDKEAPDGLVADLISDQGSALVAYKDLVEQGLSREQARAAMPMGTMATICVRFDLHNFLHNFLKKRLSSDAQPEMQEVARAMMTLARPLFPLCFEAFDDFVLGSLTLSRPELEVLRAFLSSDGTFFEATVRALGGKRQVDSLNRKIGSIFPWRAEDGQG